MVTRSNNIYSPTDSCPTELWSPFGLRERSQDGRPREERTVTADLEGWMAMVCEEKKDMGIGKPTTHGDERVSPHPPKSGRKRYRHTHQPGYRHRQTSRRAKPHRASLKLPALLSHVGGSSSHQPAIATFICDARVASARNSSRTDSLFSWLSSVQTHLHPSISTSNRSPASITAATLWSKPRDRKAVNEKGCRGAAPAGSGMPCILLAGSARPVDAAGWLWLFGFGPGLIAEASLFH